MSVLLLGYHEVLILFAQVINKHLRMNASIDLESLTEIP